MINSFHNDIADNEQADFVYLFYFVLMHFKKFAISSILLGNDSIIYE
jgi:hypothetical protein